MAINIQYTVFQVGHFRGASAWLFCFVISGTKCLILTSWGRAKLPQAVLNRPYLISADPPPPIWHLGPHFRTRLQLLYSFKMLFSQALSSVVRGPQLALTSYHIRKMFQPQKSASWPSLGVV